MMALLGPSVRVFLTWRLLISMYGYQIDGVILKENQPTDLIDKWICTRNIHFHSVPKSAKSC